MAQAQGRVVDGARHCTCVAVREDALRHAVGEDRFNPLSASGRMRTHRGLRAFRKGRIGGKAPRVGAGAAVHLVAECQDIGGKPVGRRGDGGESLIERRLDFAQPGGHHRIQKVGLAGIEPVDVGVRHPQAPSDFRHRHVVGAAGAQQIAGGGERPSGRAWRGCRLGLRG